MLAVDGGRAGIPGRAGTGHGLCIIDGDCVADTGEEDTCKGVDVGFC